MFLSPQKYDKFEYYFQFVSNSLYLGGIVCYQLWHYKIQSISLSLKISDVNLAHSRLLTPYKIHSILCVYVYVSVLGSVLKKELIGGLGLSFGSEILDILNFLGLEKFLLFFLGLKILHLLFWDNNFDTGYFLGVRLNDLDLQNCSLKSDQILERKTLTSNSQGRMDPALT